MGSLASKIHDDEVEYRHLCEKYYEKYVEVYSTHYYWLMKKHEESITLSFDEYQKNYEKDRIMKLIEKKEKELSQLREQLSNL